MNIPTKYLPGMLDILRKNGFKEVKLKSSHEKYRLIKDSTVIIYKTGKMQVQGESFAVLQTLSLLRGKEPSKILKTDIIIGSDETLKGDTFGGLVVAGFKGGSNIRSKLLALGVRDSKSLSVQQIFSIGNHLKKEFSNNFSVIELMPQEYNEKVEYTSVTGLLNQMHDDVYTKLKPGKHVVDKYPGCKVGDEIIERAESKYLEVAAASIMARLYGLKQFKRLSEQAGFNIPRGSTHVKQGLEELKRRKLDKNKFVKTHFKNVQAVF